MAYSNFVFIVGTEDGLNAAIANLDAIGKTGNNNGLSAGAYTIRFTQNVTHDGTAGGTYAAQNADGTTGAALPLNSGSNLYTVQGSSQLYALNLTTSTSVAMDGAGVALDGNGANTTGAQAYNGFFVYDGTVGIQNLTIADTVAQGGSSNGGGGGAGLGGDLFVAGPNATSVGAATTIAGGTVTLSNVSFSGNAARGGSGGTGDTTSSTGGGGLGAGADVFVQQGGTLTIQGTATRSIALDGTGTVQVNTGTATLSSNFADGNAQGGGTGALVRTGAATLSLTNGTSGYSDGTTITGGVLERGAAGGHRLVEGTKPRMQGSPILVGGPVLGARSRGAGVFLVRAGPR